MKKVLLLTAAALMIASVAMADNVGVYSDGTGSSCIVAPGFQSTTAVVHKYSQGTTLSRWKATAPAGSSVFSFTPTLGFNAIGTWNTDISVAYGQCMAGSFAVGTFAAIWNPGVIDLGPADLQTSVLSVDCLFAEGPATGSDAYVGGTPPGACDVATEQSTWGGVKALYR